MSPASASGWKICHTVEHDGADLRPLQRVPALEFDAQVREIGIRKDREKTAPGTVGHYWRECLEKFGA